VSSHGERVDGSQLCREARWKLKLHSGVRNREHEGKTHNLGYAVLGVCCTWCMLYLVYACTRCQLMIIISNNPSFCQKHPGVPEGSDGSVRTWNTLRENYRFPSPSRRVALHSISKMYFSHWKPPGVSERMWSVHLDGSISGEYQTLGRHFCQPSE